MMFLVAQSSEAKEKKSQKAEKIKILKGSIYSFLKDHSLPSQKYLKDRQSLKDEGYIYERQDPGADIIALESSFDKVVGVFPNDKNLQKQFVEYSAWRKTTKMFSELAEEGRNLEEIWLKAEQQLAKIFTELLIILWEKEKLITSDYLVDITVQYEIFDYDFWSYSEHQKVTTENILKKLRFEDNASFTWKKELDGEIKIVATFSKFTLVKPNQLSVELLFGFFVNGELRGEKEFQKPLLVGQKISVDFEYAGNWAKACFEFKKSKILR